MQDAGLGTLSAYWTHLGSLHRSHPLLPDPGRLPVTAKHLPASHASTFPATRMLRCGWTPPLVMCGPCINNMAPPSPVQVCC